MFSEKPHIEITKDGPIVVSHPKLKLIQNAQTFESSSIALCRCGNSSKKPLCDGSHVKSGFKAQGSIITF